jgi:(2R)-sulfolactate sulfo-lyase subunit alpha
MTGQSVAQQTGSAKPGQKAPDFLVHQDGDSVGVVVIEGVKAGTELTGWIMREDRTVAVKVLNDVPIGHKVALTDMAAGDGVVKYGVDIGKAVAAIKRGEHVHVHNLKTRRW